MSQLSVDFFMIFLVGLLGNFEFYALFFKYFYPYFTNNSNRTPESVFSFSLCSNKSFVSNKNNLLESIFSFGSNSKKSFTRNSRKKKKKLQRSKDTICRSKKAKSSDEQPDSHFEKLDVTSLKYPGIYEILDVKNNKSYYGQSSLLFRRMMHHHQGFMNETHECKALMAAFKEQGKPIDNFRFIVLKAGPEWEDENVRLEYENKLVEQNKDRCYNNDGSYGKNKKSNIRKPLMYNGKFYSSSRRAAAGEGLGRTTILRHLDSPNYPDVYYLEQELYGEIPVFGKQGNGFSVLFSSMGDCVRAQYATSVQNARRKVHRNEEGWRYAHLDEKKPLRIPYTLKPGEIHYEQYVYICSFVYSVNFILTNSK
jgi:hypothetical protein